LRSLRSIEQGLEGLPILFGHAVVAAGFSLATNVLAAERATLLDEAQAPIETVDLGPFTEPNKRFFLGSLAKRPFRYVFLDTSGGARCRTRPSSIC
jgi:hypothetical protein